MRAFCDQIAYNNCLLSQTMSTNKYLSKINPAWRNIKASNFFAIHRMLMNKTITAVSFSNKLVASSRCIAKFILPSLNPPPIELNTPLCSYNVSVGLLETPLGQGPLVIGKSSPGQHFPPLVESCTTWETWGKGRTILHWWKLGGMGILVPSIILG